MTTTAEWLFIFCAMANTAMPELQKNPYCPFLWKCCHSSSFGLLRRLPRKPYCCRQTASSKLPTSLIRSRAAELAFRNSTDLNNRPVLQKNRIAVPIEILAPNNRPVQITDDMERFWAQHYPELKKTLSRRYPKHEWR